MPEQTHSTAESIRRSISSKRPIVINFTTSQVPQCEQVTQVLRTLSKEPENANLEYIHVDAQAVPDIAKEWKIEAAPTVVIFRNGVEAKRVVGADITAITKAVRDLSQQSLSSPAGDLNTRLHNLINSAQIMLFMKGSPSQPKCGFSRKMVDVLNTHGATYSTFDILEDEEVRQGLKTYSNWPTYPQLYVKGELIGGLDIVNELVAAGELSDVLSS